MQIRTARVADAGRLVDLLVGGALRAVEDPSDLAPYQAALQEIIDSPASTLLVVEDDSEEGGREVVGMCQVITFRHLQQRGGLCAELEAVHVDARFRNRGIGGVLLAAAVDWARSRGCYRVQLTSNKTRTAAHRFYLRHGFEASHEGFKRYL
jgi:GNAT superfamily N-acetyltransferase